MITSNEYKQHLEAANALLAQGWQIVTSNYLSMPGLARQDDVDVPYDAFDFVNSEGGIYPIKRSRGAYDVPTPEHLTAYTATCTDNEITLQETDLDGNTTGPTISADWPDTETRSATDERRLLYMLNEAFQKDGALAGPIIDLDNRRTQQPNVVYLSTTHVMIHATSVCYDPQRRHIVAAQIITTDKGIFKALMATLAKSSGESQLRIWNTDNNLNLLGLKRSYKTISTTLSSRSAEGTVTVLLHPLTGDPAQETADYFYVLADNRDQLTQQFVDRLNLAIPWPIADDWGDAIFNAGLQAGLIKSLDHIGDDQFPGVAVQRNSSEWYSIINDCLENNAWLHQKEVSEKGERYQWQDKKHSPNCYTIQPLRK